MIAARIGPKNGSSLARIGRYFGFIAAEHLKLQRDSNRTAVFVDRIATGLETLRHNRRDRDVRAGAHPEVAIPHPLSCATRWHFHPPRRVKKGRRRLSGTNSLAWADCGHFTAGQGEKYPWERRPRCRRSHNLSGMKDHLAHRLAAGEHLECVRGLREREGAVDK